MKPLAALVLTLSAIAIPGLARAQQGATQDAPRNRVSITIEGDYRTVRSNGIPDHPTGQFPNAHNPNTIREQNYNYRMPAHPKVAQHTTPLGMYPFGVAVNGVPYDPGAAEWWQRNPQSGWQYEPMSGAIDLGLDRSRAHVQPDGAYHYHAIPTELVARLLGPKGQMKMVQLGWAADGFPIYGPWGHAQALDGKSPLKELKSSYRLRPGTRPDAPGGRYDGSFVQDYEYVAGSGDLDECNGRFGATPEFPDGIYHYYLTAEFPYIPRRFRGTPDSSFFRKGPPGGFGQGGFGPGGPGGGFGGPPGRFPPPPGYGPPPPWLGPPPPGFGPPPG